MWRVLGAGAKVRVCGGARASVGVWKQGLKAMLADSARYPREARDWNTSVWQEAGGESRKNSLKPQEPP